MGWVTRSGRVAATYAVKYGPHAVAVWKVAGSHVEAAARAKVDEVSARRTAFDHAGTVARGSVLRVVHRGHAVFVVLAGRTPVAAYPEVDVPLEDLVATADLDRSVTPEERREQRVRERVRRRARRERG